MKCQKCNAENINEAVKCGICGVRLKHTQIHNDYTGSKQVQSSEQRDTRKKETFNANSNIKSQQTIPSNQSHTSIIDTIFNKNIAVEEKARILLDSWEKAQNQPKKKNLKIVWIVLAIFMFGPTVLGVVTSVIIPTITSLAKHSESDQEEAVTEEAIAEENKRADDEIDSIKNQLYPRFMAIEEFQKDIEKYYKKTGNLPTELKQLEPYSETGFSDYTYQYFKIRQHGTIIGLFRLEPEKKIYSIPQISNKKIVGWMCYSIGISDDMLKNCEYLDKDPF